MTSPPSRGFWKQQSRLLADIRGFDKSELKTCATRVSTVLGERVECLSRCQAPEHEEENTSRQLQVQNALKKLTLARQFAGKDKYPCKVSEGLFIGSIGAARNIKSLQKCGITHILNASPAVPCFFQEHGNFEYLTVDLFDDPDANLLVHIDRANNFISQGRAAGGVLVHCYAGQSRSAALLMAYLMACENKDMVSAWSMVRKGRPQAKPNSGFLKQLTNYSTELGREGAFEIA